MANLLTLKLPLTSLPKQSQLDLHEAIRVSRKVSKVLKVKKAKAVNTRVNKVNKMVSNMSPEQAKALLEQLKNEGRI